MVRPKNKFISIVLALLALLPALMLLMTFYNPLIEPAIARSRDIERMFAGAARSTEAFYRAHGRMPTDAEFDSIASVVTGEAENSPLMLAVPPFDAGMIAGAGKPPPDGFVLSYWRGESMEHYVSWTRRSTLNFDRSAYFLFHSQLLQALLMVVGVMLCIAASVWTWPPARVRSKT